jgi:hypothetical protein
MAVGWRWFVTMMGTVTCRSERWRAARSETPAGVSWSAHAARMVPGQQHPGLCLTAPACNSNVGVGLQETPAGRSPMWAGAEFLNRPLRSPRSCAIQPSMGDRYPRSYTCPRLNGRRWWSSFTVGRRTDTANLQSRDPVLCEPRLCGVGPNVRGSTGYGRTYTHLDDVDKRMDSVADLKAAADWLRASGRVDGERIAVMGGSYGALWSRRRWSPILKPGRQAWTSWASPTS